MLHLAASNENSKCLEFILSQKEGFLNQHCNNINKSTALHFAVISECYDNAKSLLRHGALPNVQDGDGNTPMHYAVMKEDIKMVKLLDEFGADAKIKNQSDMSAIDISVSEDLKEVKVFFMSRSQYSQESFKF